jgi:KipI family sensor histidine kinase inhibitor
LTCVRPAGGAETRLWRMPCCYAPELALDREVVSRTTGLSWEEVVSLHSGVTHYVYMLGFAPGQPYLGDLPEALALPRRKDPRPRVDKGSVATATGLSVVYPIANACGWHVIGRTPVPIFDPMRTSACARASGPPGVTALASSALSLNARSPAARRFLAAHGSRCTVGSLCVPSAQRKFIP